MSKLYQGNEFELAYSDIQRETGAASVTLKRAIQSLVNDQVIEVGPGRNSRYARFRYLPASDERENIQVTGENEPKTITSTRGEVESLFVDVQELSHHVDYLQRRVRNQEMTIALLQDRLAEVEDKIRKR